MEEKEYFCRGCGKIIKVTMLTEARCPFCEYQYYIYFSKSEEVDWISRIVGRQGCYKDYFLKKRIEKVID